LLPSIRRQYELACRYAETLANWLPAQTAATQLEKLQTVWEDCLRDVPYYRDLVARGAAPKRIASWDDFRAIPILDRRALKEHAAAFRRLSGPPARIATTGGSTGQPVRIGQWRQEQEVLRVAKLVPWIRCGYTPGDSIYLIWGHAHLLGSGWRRHWNHAVRKLKDRMLGYRRVNAYTMDAAKAALIAEDIIRRRPCGLIGYAAVLDLLVRHAERYCDQLRRANVRFVMSCAEPPPKADTFDVLRSAFACPILQEFGGVDFGHVAAKYDDEPFRVFPDLNVLEAEPAAGESERGAAVVTTLYPRYTPLIRYRQGDLLGGVKKQEYGHVHEFDELAGRCNDVLEMLDGAAIHSVGLMHCFKEEDDVFNVQLVLTDGGPRFRLVVRSALAPAVELRIRARLRQLHGAFSEAAFDYVTDLTTTRAGKRRWFVDERSTPVHA
jgi:phenylacetate-coenzyme A ligase PaaK-like adenylate-forming protein